MYIKPTDSFTYLEYNSFHPLLHTKQSIVYSQLLRYKRITSDPTMFEADAINLGKHFIRRGYPVRFINNALTSLRVSKKRRDTKPKDGKNERIPLVTTYHPQVRKFASTTKREWVNIQLDPKLSVAMGEPPLHSQRQPPNLKSLLVRSELPKPNNSQR